MIIRVFKSLLNTMTIIDIIQLFLILYNYTFNVFLLHFFIYLNNKCFIYLHRHIHVTIPHRTPKQQQLSNQHIYQKMCCELAPQRKNIFLKMSLNVLKYMWITSENTCEIIAIKIDQRANFQNILISSLTQYHFH